MLHDLNLQQLWDGMQCKAHVRRYVNWLLNTCIAMWTEAQNNLK